MVALDKTKLLRDSLLISLCLIFPISSFGQGGENALEFFGLLLHILIFIFIILPLIFLTINRKKTRRILISALIYLLSVPSIVWFGNATYSNFFDPDESSDELSFIVFFYFITVLSCFILTLIKDIKDYIK